MRVAPLAAIALCLADQVAFATPRAPRPPLRIDSELEYYAPLKPDRSIDSVFANVVVGIELLRGALVLEAGLTATGAWGHITEDVEQRAVRLDAGVFGAGPMILVRCAPLQLGRFTLLFDVVGALVVYSSHFPPGGDLYNLTWRLGGAVAIRVSYRLALTAGVRWMHVSNGQGLGPQNPSYEGIGFPLGLVYRF